MANQNLYSLRDITIASHVRIEAPPLKITMGDSWSLEYKYTSIITSSCSEAKKHSLERQQQKMKIELRSI